MTPALMTPQTIEAAGCIVFATIGVLGVAVAILITIGIITHFMGSENG